MTTQEVARVSKAVADAVGTLKPVPPEFGKPSVTAGCPAPIPLTGKQLDFYDLRGTLAKGFRDAAQLSPFRVFVYFVPDTVYAASLGDFKPYAKATAETLCRGDTCTEVTVSIYAPDSISDAELANGVLGGLALEPRTPEPTFDWSSCNQGTPRPECERYFYCLSVPPEDPRCKTFWQGARITPPPR